MEMVDSKELLEAQAHVWNHTFNYMTSVSLRSAVQLGIPDIISNYARPVTLPELVAQLSIPQTKSHHLYRLMRILVHTGFFAVQKDDQGQEGYVHTYSSKVLSKKQPGNLVPLILWMTDPITVTPCLSIADWFRGSESTPFEAVHRTSMYDYFGTHLESGKAFNKAMANYSDWVVTPLVKHLKPILKGFESLVDVGGGIGTVAKAISEALPQLRCTVYDLPHVISDIKGVHNISLVAGDMFEFVPAANVILLKEVLIDWSDGECLKILMRCREAISKENTGGKLIIVDTVTNNASQGALESVKADLGFDIYTMSCVTGKERTDTEWKKLFMEAGFSSYKIISAGFTSIIEVFP